MRSIPSKLAAVSGPASSEPLCTIKVVVISDYICPYCYLSNKILRDAIEAIRFDVEFRPFTLVNSSIASSDQVIYYNDYITKKLGKEQAKVELKLLTELAQKAGLQLAGDSIVSSTVQAHRMSMKAYQEGGQVLQDKFNSFIFDTCHLRKGASVADEEVLVDAAVSVGLMNEDEAKRFLCSTEYLGGVEEMVEAAKTQGVNGVPFVIIDGKWALSGIQPKESLIQIFDKLTPFPVVAIQGPYEMV